MKSLRLNYLPAVRVIFWSVCSSTICWSVVYYIYARWFTAGCLQLLPSKFGIHFIICRKWKKQTWSHKKKQNIVVILLPLFNSVYKWGTIQSRCPGSQRGPTATFWQSWDLISQPSQPLGPKERNHFSNIFTWTLILYATEHGSYRPRAWPRAYI